MTQVAVFLALCCLAADPAGGPKRTPEPVRDPMAKVCETDLDCPVGQLCGKNELLDPAKACLPGCRQKAPRCPPTYTCEQDKGFGFVWYRCRAPNGGPFLGDPS